MLASAANTHDSRLFEPLLETNPGVRGRRGDPGRPRRRPEKLHADKGYDYPRCRRYLHRRGIKVRIARRGIEDRNHLGRHRWVVERTISWVLRFKRLGLRYDRTTTTLLPLLLLAVTLINFRRPCAKQVGYETRCKRPAPHRRRNTDPLLPRPSPRPQPGASLPLRGAAQKDMLMGVRKLFLNRGVEDELVEAPAFSLTKVMAAIAPLVTAVVTLLAATLAEVEFTSAEITTLLVVLIAFLAVTGAADVLARAVAASARHAATSAARERLIRFPTPLSASIAAGGADPPVSVIAAAAGPEYLCVREDGTATWESADNVRFAAAATP